MTMTREDFNRGLKPVSVEDAQAYVTYIKQDATDLLFCFGACPVQDVYRKIDAVQKQFGLPREYENSIE